MTALLLARRSIGRMAGSLMLAGYAGYIVLAQG
jgi:hypothetical protein